MKPIIDLTNKLFSLIYRMCLPRGGNPLTHVMWHGTCICPMITCGDRHPWRGTEKGTKGGEIRGGRCKVVEGQPPAVQEVGGLECWWAQGT
jgi:hypothetical protein